MEKIEISDNEMSSIQREAVITEDAPSIGENSDPNNSNSLHNINTAATDGYEYITGVKLFLVLALVTAVAFLSMLDTTIVVTVGLP